MSASPSRLRPFEPPVRSSVSRRLHESKSNAACGKKIFVGADAKKPRQAGLFLKRRQKLSGCFRDVRGLRSLLTLNYFELHLVALSERFKSRPTDRAEMDKDVWATLA